MPTQTVLSEIQALERQLDMLGRRYFAASEQLVRTLAAADKPVIEAQMQHFLEEMTRVEGEIEALRRAGRVGTSAQRQVHEALFHEIDFVKPWRDFRMIFEDYVDLPEGGGALLLLPDFQTMCADLLIRRMRSWLDEKRYGAVVYRRVELQPLEPLSPAQLLRKLGGYLNLEPPSGDGGDLSAYTTKLIKTLMDSLDAGQVLVLEIAVIPELYSEETFVRWFLEKFWEPLLAGLTAASGERHFLRCITLVAADHPLPEAPPLAERYCPTADYCEESIRQLAYLPLSRWGVDDIDRWLRRHSGLFQAADPAVAQQAARIHGSSRNGEPIYVLNNLRRLVDERAE
jgi:hypothetical protein